MRDISFSIDAGESVGLLGANGAGKSSTLKAILGMLRPITGEIQTLGASPGSLISFEKLGFAPEEGVPPDYLTGKEYLGFVSALKNSPQGGQDPQVDELLSWFELDPNKPIREYSKGMKRRIVLAQSFLGGPQLIILDEPLNGLDPLMIIKLRTRLNETREKGTALLYSSHILSEVEKCCSRVLILKEGKLVLDASISAITDEFGSVENAFAKKVGDS
ncbi:MAG: ABC transporter ATP-binding protein [Pseudomonadota bacterium]